MWLCRMGRRLGIVWFDLKRLHVTGSINVDDGGYGPEKDKFENEDSRDEGRRSLCFVFAEFKIQRQKNTLNIFLSVNRP